jgi:hypothetical protein
LHCAFADDSASGSVIVSSLSCAQLSLFATIGAVFKVSTTGTIQLQMAVSAAANADTLLGGSYMQVFKIG